MKISFAILSLMVVPFVIAGATTIETQDGLEMLFSHTDGRVEGLISNGAALPFEAGMTGGFSIQTAVRIPSSVLLDEAFSSECSSYHSASGSNWDSSTQYYSWSSSGGIEDSGHLTLGNGANVGVGVASGSISVDPNTALRISWYAESATTETMQIVSFRQYDSEGVDITSEIKGESGWAWTSATLGHSIWGIQNSQANTWEPFEETYLVSSRTEFVAFALRYWTGGDGLVQIDNLKLEVVGGLEWNESVPVSGPWTETDSGLTQDAVLSGVSLSANTSVTAGDDFIDLQIEIQDLSDPLASRALKLLFDLPLDLAGYRWWDDIDESEPIEGEHSLTFRMEGHDFSFYPYSAVTNASDGLSMAVAMGDPRVQRFEAVNGTGYRSVWELALSPETTKIGPGSASATLRLYRFDPEWGFRASSEKYYSLFPEDFVKRTRREGSWLYPIPPSQIPDFEDFGFAFFETWPIDEAEIQYAQDQDIAVFDYTESWLAWQRWVTDEGKPSYQTRVDLVESWASSLAADYWTWVDSGGTSDSPHLLLGDSATTGAGMALEEPFDIVQGDTMRIDWMSKVSNTASKQILGVRLYDSGGTDITAQTSAPSGWFYSGTSRAHVVSGISNSSVGVWESMSRDYVIPSGVTSARVSIRYWSGGDGSVRIDDCNVHSAIDSTVYWNEDFSAGPGDIVAAYNSQWDDVEGPTWLRESRELAAQSVLNSSPMDDEGKYLIDYSNYLWNSWSSTSVSQAWPVNPDPDIPEPNVFTIFRDLWVDFEKGITEGVYFDSVSSSAGVGTWSNFRSEHIAVCDYPLTYSSATGDPVEMAVSTSVEYLTLMKDKLHSEGRLSMMNLFPDVTRFHAHNCDVFGSEVSSLEDARYARLRRTLANQKIVSNLLQWGWAGSEYMTHEQMEDYITDEIFWGIYPGVCSGGGPGNGSVPERYFVHPELYERDRPLFQKYMPVVKALSTAGWEVITNAVAEPDIPMERFGDFRRGSVYLTVRNDGETSATSQISTDLSECGLLNPDAVVDVFDVIDGESVTFQRESQPQRINFSCELDPGSIKVYELRPQQTASAFMSY